ncbi:sulfotransferase family 2 domain-containing protein [Roseobacter weihaiensis]|uniref:sulfotransferase family 2 domain-containing protein n=1 Tax=Roseobacter weihaiensis TaxID=2763262 RepID=UPI001D09C607|nr:sulfotransferase family 2 domain-containing protein [Roseobacter sp. H9]
MIVSKGRNYIFVHIPKTGGTSLAQALEERAMRDDLLIGDTPKARRRKRRLRGIKTAGRLWKHATLADIDGLLSPEEVAAFFTFTLVRNPWDRAVSYYHWLRAQSFAHPAVGLAKTRAFAPFLREPSIQKAFAETPARRYMTDALGHEQCDAYIRLEHFTQDAAPLFDHLGFAVTLPHVNASARTQEYGTYYDAETSAIIADVCAADIARFAYSFDG